MRQEQLMDHNNMRLPGFTAAASLPDTNKSYLKNMETIARYVFLQPGQAIDLAPPSILLWEPLGRKPPGGKRPGPMKPAIIEQLESLCPMGGQFYSISTTPLPPRVETCGYRWRVRDLMSTEGKLIGSCAGSVKVPDEVNCDDGCFIKSENDARHCGRKGIEECLDCIGLFGPNTSCAKGMCVDEHGCKLPEELWCRNKCMDVGELKTSEDNCGGCKKLCGPDPDHDDAKCIDGKCEQFCSPGRTECSGVCRDLGSDRDNCNKCGKECTSVTICKNGVCTQCPVGQTSFCTGQCQNIKGSSCCGTQTENNGRTVWACTKNQDVCKYQFNSPDGVGPLLTCYSNKPNP